MRGFVILFRDINGLTSSLCIDIQITKTSKPKPIVDLDFVSYSSKVDTSTVQQFYFAEGFIRECKG